MCDSHDQSGSLLTGLVIGAAVGAGLTFLFGTKKGKEIRDRVREEYPEAFDKIDEVYANLVDEVKNVEEEVAEMSDETKEVVQEKVANLGEAVENLGKQLETVAPGHRVVRRFLKSGRKL